MKVTGKAIGSSSSEIQIKRFEKVYVRIEPILNVERYIAGRLALRYPKLSIAGILIATVAQRLRARVITDDLHYEVLGVNTVWYR